ncbi:MAG TPA: response regulator transcription factor [Anaeromyxobacteraceae bacterium]|nr:response regulator transcription factor [Anaeromyxobacteraceae bacterium]
MTAPAAARVLLVDDDAEICTFLATLLELEGLEPAVAGSAEEALGMTAGAAAILVDVAMPAVDGLELCRRMRAAGVTAPIIVVSARPGSDLPRRAADAGADDFVRKPFDNAELIARIRRWIAARPA